MATTQKPNTRDSAPWVVVFYRSDVGKKWIMAITGIFLLLFVLSHMLGNLKVFLSPEEIDLYGEALRDLGGHLVPRTLLLWLMRIGLTATFAVHIVAAYQLAIRSRKTRGTERYEASRHWIASNYASRTMRWTGTIVLLFLVFHLADLTWGTPTPPATTAFERGEVYANLVASLSRPGVAATYIVANIALGFHIYHGSWSLFQSIGANNPRYNEARVWLAGLLTATIVVGNLAIPIAVMTGVVA